MGEVSSRMNPSLMTDCAERAVSEPCDGAPCAAAERADVDPFCHPRATLRLMVMSSGLSAASRRPARRVAAKPGAVTDHIHARRQRGDRKTAIRIAHRRADAAGRVALDRHRRVRDRLSIDPGPRRRASHLAAWGPRRQIACSRTEPAAESIQMPTMSARRQRFNTLRINTPHQGRPLLRGLESDGLRWRSRDEAVNSV